MQPIAENWRAHAHAFATRHHKVITSAVLVLLGGTAVAAFGIAPLAPDAARLPQQLVIETVQPQGIEQQLDALAGMNLTLRRGTLTKASDTAAGLLSRLGINDPAAAEFLRTDPTARRVLQGRGKSVQAITTESGALRQLVARYAPERSAQLNTHFTRLSIERVGEQWQAKVENAPLSSQTRFGSGTIRSSLFAATDDAGLSDVVAIQLAEIFSTEIDFHRELRKGDTFSVVYEALTADGEPVSWNDGAGKVLAAEFVNNGKVHQAVWFSSDGQKGSYYGFDGQSKRHAFLASPMAFSRITSGFANRFHPILKTWRAHLGVDYGAPIGTSVRSVGDGVVEFAGRQNGYGNVVILKHGNERSTLYAHLSRIDVKKGERVDQGEPIGAVGMTGWSTGPHLHFEFRVNGHHVDPLQIAKASETITLDPAARAQFALAAPTVKAKLEIAESLLGTRTQAE